MTYQEEEQARLRRQSSKQAINLAMEGRWQEAVAANKGLLESFPNDIAAYNRLGRAYVELGDYAAARQAYEKALELDAYNTIARKNLERLNMLGDATASTGEATVHKVEPHQFIEEVGKAGVVNLVHLAAAAVLARVVAGDAVELRVEGNNLMAYDGQGERLGRVEPRHGQRLVKLTDSGNRYTATVISSSPKTVTIIIREAYQDPSNVGRLSFPPKGGEGQRTYVSDRIIRRELEYEEALPGESSYTIVGSEGTEVVPEEVVESEEEQEEEE